MKNLSSIALLLGPIASLQAYAEVYMTDAQAASLIFPHEQLERKNIELSPADIQAIEAASGETVRAKQVTVFRNAQKNAVFIDQVLGKHEFITYAVGIAQGKIASIEIIEYRETYGQKVREEVWRKQFSGKDIQAKFRVNDDINNVSGATLSSAHITAGVKRILHTYAILGNRI